MKSSEDIKKIIQNISPIGDRKEQILQSLNNDSPRISTGWLSVDKALCGGLANELYIIGAETSTGKSALFMNMAQNCAEKGVNVLYFSLEMGADEFVARGISSISFVAHSQDENKRKVTAGDILYHSYDEMLQNFTKLKYSTYSDYAEEYFQRYRDRFYIIEGGIKGVSAKDVANIATLFKQTHPNEQLVVFVDYLQLLKADADDHSQADRKTKTDVAVTTLKALASQVGMPVLTISSVGRDKYSDRISTGSFKESGDTEYTGGILIGWNWLGVTDVKDKDKIQKEKDLCAKRGYRLMSFEILKYRNGVRDRSVTLAYFPAYSYLVDIYDWHPDVWGTNPFEEKKTTPSSSNYDYIHPDEPRYERETLRY